MTPPPQPGIGYRIGGAVFERDEYLKLLKARRRASQDLSGTLTRLLSWVFPDHNLVAIGQDLEAFRDALTAFLTVDVDASIKGIEENPGNQMPAEWTPPPVSMEDLATITMQCEKLEHQLEDLEDAAEHMPGMGAIIRSAIMPMLEFQLSQFQQNRDRMQEAFDQQQQVSRPPSSEPASGPGESG
jgi:hypothetical protein